MLKIVALISGGGSILEALLKACDDPNYPAEIVAVGSDTDAPGLDYAVARNIPTFIVRPEGFSSRKLWGKELLRVIRSHNVGVAKDKSLILSAGLMRILPKEFVDETSPNLINTHPALLPNFPGAHAVADAVAAGVKETGVTVHIIDAGIDTGPILKQATVAILDGENEHELHERIKQVERPLLVEVVRAIATGEISLESATNTKGE
ncbi:MAG TPA: phosphoribosylglycinamide formyltransferase [Microbacteriaceae bacterium]|nr:phosphoribosylglycinamide formyltransferase [Microbacteriaceae bacterium]